MKEIKVNFDIHKYIGIIARRRWVFLVPLAIIYSLFLISSFFLPKVYEAKAIILIEDKKLMNPLLQNLAVSTTVQSKMNSLREDILSWPRIYQLVERLDLNKDIETPLQLETLIAGIKKNIRLEMKSGEIVIISYQGKDPKNTQLLVNTLCDILIERNMSSQTEDTSSAIDFINQQLKIYKGKLDDADADLRNFKEVYGLGTLPGLEESSPTGVTLAKINSELANLESDLVMASIECTDEHPRVKGLKTRISSLKEKRKSYIEEVAQRAGIEPKNYVDISDSGPRQQEELARLSRDKAINEKIYAMFLERLETANITENLDNSENRTKFRIIEPARLPLVPIKPDKIKHNLLGLFLGAMAGGGLVYFLEYIDSSFCSEEDLKQAFDIPVLGNISKIITEDDIENNQKKRRQVTVLIGIVAVALAIAVVIASNLDFVS